MQTHTLGFPRIGAKRELKFLLEQYWQGSLTEQAFKQKCKQIRETNWQTQLHANIDCLPVGDFAHYDHVLNTSLYLGIVPKRFAQQKIDLSVEFAIARGKTEQCCQHAASDMTKWFNTNYHYIVPELDKQSTFSVNIQPLLDQIEEAKLLTSNIKPVLVGPLTYLYLANVTQAEKLDFLPALINAYQEIFDQLNSSAVNWLQIDEPILGLELSNEWKDAFVLCYQSLNRNNLRILLTTYFASVDHQVDTIKQLNVDGLHIDTIAEPTDISAIIASLPEHWIISLGVINGRNVWKSDLVNLYQTIKPLYQTLADRLWLAPSCSLIHSPVDLDSEQNLSPQIQSWLAFAKQKCEELALLKQALLTHNTQQITQYSAPVLARLVSKDIKNAAVQNRLNQLNESQFTRNEKFATRKTIQQQRFNLPILPTTTIGSFPQTNDIRQIRAKWRRKQLTNSEYENAIKQEIALAIQRQEQLDLDVLVHGEPERNDMVEYFGEQLSGFAFTQFGWVQSFGSRCVKPPIIYGDVSRPNAMTVAWTEYAQSLTNRPVKGMLTGPVTILCWSFVRDDISRAEVANQIALAINDEVNDLINAGIHIIQIDEPAIREGMPLKASQWQHYLQWATAAFRLSAACAPAYVQIHSHMCYSEFNEILDAIIALDADVLTVETSRSNMALLNAFEQRAYPNNLGPGVYDIHSANVPESKWITDLLKKAQQYIPLERLWINPDCGLKTRQWPETEQALTNMVNAAKALRSELTVEKNASV